MPDFERCGEEVKALLAPSLLSANLAALASEADALAAARIPWLHLDVMDGSFVPNITFGAPVIAALRKSSSLFFDAHLMIEDPGRHVADFAKAGANIIVPHIEAMAHPQRTLAQIRELGLKAGVALNPDTEISRLRWLLPYVDMILIMGVNPGFSGQKFLPQTVEKIRECRAFLREHGHVIPIEVDGGADLSNAAELAEAGANILVSGSAFFLHSDYELARENFERALSGANLDAEALRALKIALAWHA